MEEKKRKKRADSWQKEAMDGNFRKYSSTVIFENSPNLLEKKAYHFIKELDARRIKKKNFLIYAINIWSAMDEIPELKGCSIEILLWWIKNHSKFSISELKELKEEEMKIDKKNTKETEELGDDIY